MSYAQRRFRLVLTSALAATGLTMSSHLPAFAQAAWKFELEWEQPGEPALYYRLCIDDRCSTLPARSVAGGRWRAPLPLLAPGEHRLVLQACGPDGCISGNPEVFVRVVRPNPRTPPVITGAPR